ncbi:hypothetical protein ACJRO7_032072, partial [Eucalyptus globulus]
MVTVQAPPLGASPAQQLTVDPVLPAPLIAPGSSLLPHNQAQESLEMPIAQAFEPTITLAVGTS